MSNSQKEELKEVNLNKPADHYVYDNIEIQWGIPEHYEILSKLGRGRYSEVFEVLYKQTDLYCLKILKPIKTKKIKREIKILQILKNHPNIIQLKDILRDSSTKTISLVFDHIKNLPYKILYPKLSYPDIKLYMYQVLQALSFAHSNGIMHRDIKPNNILIDQSAKKAVLIDWGLSEFYFPEKDYSTKVGSRFYKAPELLLNFTKYNYSIDIWAAGCTFAEMLFQVYPLFPGTDNKDQVEKITRLLGTNELSSYREKYKIQLDNSIENILEKHKKSSLQLLVNKEILQQCGNEVLDLLAKMLVYDHEQRITAKKALEHPYFADITIKAEDNQKVVQNENIQSQKQEKKEGTSKKNKKKNK